MAALGLGVVQLAVGMGLCGVVWWVWGESLEGVRKWDGRLMGLVDVRALLRQGSWLDEARTRSSRQGILGGRNEDMDAEAWV